MFKVITFLTVLIICSMMHFIAKAESNELVFPEGVEYGYVLFKFDISTLGKAENIEVIEESPKDVFRKSALKAIKSWTFKIKVVDGNPVVQKGMTYKMEFKLEE